MKSQPMTGLGFGSYILAFSFCMKVERRLDLEEAAF